MLLYQGCTGYHIRPRPRPKSGQIFIFGHIRPRPDMAAGYEAGYEVGFDHFSMHLPHSVIGHEFMLLYCLYFCSGQLALYINKCDLERVRNGQDWTTRLSPSLSTEKLCFRAVHPSFRLCVHHESLRTSFINHLGYFHQIYYFCTLHFECTSSTRHHLGLLGVYAVIKK